MMSSMGFSLHKNDMVFNQPCFFFFFFPQRKRPFLVLLPGDFWSFWAFRKSFGRGYRGFSQEKVGGQGAPKKPRTSTCSFFSPKNGFERKAFFQQKVTQTLGFSRVIDSEGFLGLRTEGQLNHC